MEGTQDIQETDDKLGKILAAHNTIKMYNFQNIKINTPQEIRVKYL